MVISSIFDYDSGILEFFAIFFRSANTENPHNHRVFSAFSLFCIVNRKNL